MAGHKETGNKYESNDLHESDEEVILFNLKPKNEKVPPPNRLEFNKQRESEVQLHEVYNRSSRQVEIHHFVDEKKKVKNLPCWISFCHWLWCMCGPLREDTEPLLEEMSSDEEIIQMDVQNINFKHRQINEPSHQVSLDRQNGNHPTDSHVPTNIQFM